MPAKSNPNSYTQVPNWYFDFLPVMSQAEALVVLVIIRQTIGYQRGSVKLSLNMLQGMTGLRSINTVRAGVDAAVSHGLIEREAGGGSGKTEWKVSKIDTLTYQNLIPNLSKFDTFEDEQVSKIDTLAYQNLIDIKKKKENNIIIDDDDDLFLGGELKELEQAIVIEARLPLHSGGPQAWTECIVRLAKAGVTPADIKQAVKVLDDKQYRITRPGSIENTAVALAAQRKRTAEKTENQTELKGAFYG